MKSKAMSSRSLRLRLVSIFMPPGVCSHLKAVHLLDAIPEFGTCLVCMRRLREQTRARLVPLHMCAWYLQPWTCEPGVFHKKPTWRLVSAEFFPWVHLFVSAIVPGSAPTTSTPSLAEAQAPGCPPVDFGDPPFLSPPSRSGGVAEPSLLHNTKVTARVG